VPAKKKNKRGRIIGEGSSTAQEGGVQQNYVPPFGGIPAPPSCYGGVPMQAWGSDAAIPPIKFCGAQRSLCGVIHTSSSTTTTCDHYWRIRCKEYANIAAILTNTNKMGEGNVNIAYVLGHLHLAPSDNS
jgi:hypothetical protein